MYIPIIQPSCSQSMPNGISSNVMCSLMNGNCIVVQVLVGSIIPPFKMKLFSGYYIAIKDKYGIHIITINLET